MYCKLYSTPRMLYTRVNTGDVQGRELVLADTSAKLRKQTQQVSFFLYFFLPFLVLTCFYALAVEVISLRLMTHRH
jgi:hypothetical protein